jgi:hypothetical protein
MALVIVGVTVGLIGPLAGPAAAKTAPIATDDACTIVTTKQAGTFGKPVAAPVPSAVKLDCKFAIGDAVGGPGGTLTALILYPNLFAARVANARAGVEDQRAIDQISGQDIQDVTGLGTSAYFNATKGEVVFAPNKKVGVILNWAPAPAGTTMTKRDRAKLLALAKAVSKRANA